MNDFETKLICQAAGKIVHRRQNRHLSLVHKGGMHLISYRDRIHYCLHAFYALLIRCCLVVGIGSLYIRQEEDLGLRKSTYESRRFHFIFKVWQNKAAYIKLVGVWRAFVFAKWTDNIMPERKAAFPRTGFCMIPLFQKQEPMLLC